MGRGIGTAVLCFLLLYAVVEVTAGGLRWLWGLSRVGAAMLVALWLPLAILGLADIVQRHRVLPPRAPWHQRLAWLSVVLWPLTMLEAFGRG